MDEGGPCSFPLGLGAMLKLPSCESDGWGCGGRARDRRESERGRRRGDTRESSESGREGIRAYRAGVPMGPSQALNLEPLSTKPQIPFPTWVQLMSSRALSKTRRMGMASSLGRSHST